MASLRPSSGADRCARAALLALLLLVAPSLAWGHTGLRRSEPAAGARVSAPLSTIRLWFAERAQLAVTRVRLIGPDSAAIALTLSPSPTEPKLVLAAVPGPLAAGAYRVEWQTGGRDGHPVRGQFRFTVVAGDSAAAVAAPRPDTARASGSSPSGGAFNVALDSMMRERTDYAADRLEARGGESLSEYRVARWAEFVGLLVTLGALLFHHLVVRGLRGQGFDLAARDASDATRQLALAALLLLVAAGFVRIYGEASALGGPGESATFAGIRTMALGTEWGRGWIVGMAGALLALLGVASARRAPWGWTLAAVGGIGLAFAPALTGHAAATRDLPAVAIAADVVHVAGAAGWLGVLLVVLMAGLPAVRRRPEDERGAAADALLQRFHPVARICVLLVLVSGVASAAIRLRSLDALTHTSYGSLLLYKVFIFLFAGLVGLYNWQKVLPRMRLPDGPSRLRRSASVELLVGLVILALTAVLVATEPPDMQARGEHPPSTIMNGR